MNQPKSGPPERATPAAEGGHPRIAELQREARQSPTNAQAHAALGSALSAAGALEQAAVAWRRALRLAPMDAATLLAYASVLVKLGRFDLAIAALGDGRRALPGKLSIGLALASAYRRSGNRAKALAAFGAAALSALGAGRAGSHAPSPQELARLAAKAFVHGDQDAALESARRILETSPDQPDALAVVAHVLADRADPHEAQRYARRAAMLEPFVPEFLLTLANCERLCDRHPESVFAANRAIELDPGMPKAHAVMAALMLEREQFDAAEQAARDALALEPKDSATLGKLVRALIGQGKLADAESVARAAIASLGESADLLNSLGQTLRAQGHPQEARAAFESAISLDPDDASSRLMFGLFLFTDFADTDAARPQYHAAQRLAPNDPGGWLNQAIMEMTLGDYSPESWRLYEHRRRHPLRVSSYQRIPLPEWDGRDLPGDGLLVYGEQGIGDEIMFTSMLGDAAQRVARCGFACDPRLHGLFQRSFPQIECTPWGRELMEQSSPALAAYRYTVPVGTLGMHLRSGPNALARSAAFLKADPVRVQLWRMRLAAIGPGPYVGVAWRGGMHASGKVRRSLDSAILANAFGALKMNWISLQRDAQAAELAWAQLPGQTRLAHLPEALADIDETAALVEALDAVVTVCTWLVHVCGGLGRPAFVLAPLVPDFRYGIEGRSMPWYESVRMYRQTLDRDWRAPIATLRADLEAHLSHAGATL